MPGQPCSPAPRAPFRLSPYSHDRDSLSSSQDHIPLAALPLLATSSGSYQHAVGTVITRANQAYSTFLHSAEGAGFCGQVRGVGNPGEASPWVPAGTRLPPGTFSARTACRPQVVLLGDCVGGILGFDALCQSRVGAGGSRSSSRRGSLVGARVFNPSLSAVAQQQLATRWYFPLLLQSTEPISPELCGGRDPLADGADGAAGSGQASPEPGVQGDSQQPSSSCR